MCNHPYPKPASQRQDFCIPILPFKWALKSPTFSSSLAKTQMWISFFFFIWYRFPEYPLYAGHHARWISYGSWPQNSQWRTQEISGSAFIFLIFFEIPIRIIMSRSQNGNCLAWELDSALSLNFICSCAKYSIPSGAPKLAALNYLHYIVQGHGHAGSPGPSWRMEVHPPGNLEKGCSFSYASDPSWSGPRGGAIAMWKLRWGSLWDERVWRRRSGVQFLKWQAKVLRCLLNIWV